MLISSAQDEKQRNQQWMATIVYWILFNAPFAILFTAFPQWTVTEGMSIGLFLVALLSAPEIRKPSFVFASASFLIFIVFFVAWTYFLTLTPVEMPDEHDPWSLLSALVLIFGFSLISRKAAILICKAEPLAPFSFGRKE